MFQVVELVQQLQVSVEEASITVAIIEDSSILEIKVALPDSFMWQKRADANAISSVPSVKKHTQAINVTTTENT